MKRFTKVMAVFAALVLALAFVGCGNKVVSEWSSSEGSHITLYKDGSCDFSLKVGGETYSGDGTYEDKSESALGITSVIITITGTTSDGKNVTISLSGFDKNAVGVITGLETGGILDIEQQDFTKK